MSKLTETTKRTRKYLLYFLIFVVVVLFAQFLIRLITREELGNGGTASPYAYVDEAFGPIEYPEIPSLAIADGSTPSFAVLGQFTQSPTSINVYEVSKPRETLGSSVKAKDLAQTLNFNSSAINQDQTLKWSEGGRELIFYKLTENSKYTNNSLKNSNFSKPDFLDTEEIDSLTDSLTSQLKVSYSSNFEEPSREYLIKSGSSYASTNSANSADFIKVTYPQSYEIVSLKSTTLESGTVTTDATSINGEIYYDNPNQGSFSLIVTNEPRLSSEKEDVDYLVEYENNQAQVDKESYGVYPLKSIEKAWEDVKDGNASLKYLVEEGYNPYAEYKPLEVKRFTVDPDLSEFGFYTTENWTGYVYPIYVFKGTAELGNGKTADFIFYAKALDT